MRDDDVGDFVHGYEGAIVVGDLREEDVDLILEDELVYDGLYFEWLEELLLFVDLLGDLDEVAILGLDYELVLVNQLFDFIALLFEESAIVFWGFVEEDELFSGEFVVDMAAFFCFEFEDGVLEDDIHVHEWRID